ncbi:MAG TPA: DUF1559 domain-containing protein [Armatimonadota bacterium]|jgi:prepilin-type N-terminal cleavage/methylation domain-containing protein/prepilin-type processing-associated H-X9-DG protein
MNRPGKSGFTLIELLVVIAIIAILAAILFPVFAKARSRAHQTACLSNVKQISLAFLSYFSDNEERFPPFSASPAWISGQGWTYRIAPYLKNMEVYRCPENDKSNFSYTMNAYSSVNYLGTITRVRNPSRFIHLAECPGSGNRNVKSSITGDSDLTTESGFNLPNDNQQDGVVYGTKAGGYSSTPVSNAMPIAKFRDFPGAYVGRLYFPGWHNGGNNVMFLDGHVRFFKAWSQADMTFNDYKN